MQLNVTGHHVEGTPALRGYVEKKLERIGRHFEQVIDVHCVLTVEKMRQKAEATLHLSLMNAAGSLPWALTFSYGRALQDTSLRAWGGTPAGFAGGQQQLHFRAKLNGLAAAGAYKPAMESSAA